MACHLKASITCFVPCVIATLFVFYGHMLGQTAGFHSNTSLFLPVVTYDLGNLSPQSLTVADVNGDGIPDLVVASCQPISAPSCGNLGESAEGRIIVLLGNGDGTFGAPLTYDSGTANANSVEVADVNLDGKPDLVVASCGPSGTQQCGGPDGGVVSVLLGNGDGSFQSAITNRSGGISATSVKVADVNGDGKPDIIAANVFDTYYNAKSGTVGVLLGNGDGTFSSVVPYSSGRVGATSVAVADVNADDKLDAIVGNGACPNTTDAECVGVLLGNGDGTFQPVITYKSGGGEVTSVAVGDVNGDSKPDLVVTNWCVACANTVGVLLGNGDGTFHPAFTYSTGGSEAWSVALADVNGDDRLDLLVANQCTSNIYCTDSNGSVGVLLNLGQGFQSAIKYSPGGHYTSFLVAADINGDRKPDVLVANRALLPDVRGSIGVLLNNTPFCISSPSVTISVTPKSLWPPNGELVPVIVSGKITDTGTGCALKSAAYDVKDEYGKLQPSGPVIVGIGGVYSFTAWLQASRSGTDLDGRLYTVTVTASNNAGKTGSQSDTVIVPHDQER
jgi:FG-GAP-like repeat